MNQSFRSYREFRDELLRFGPGLARETLEELGAQILQVRAPAEPEELWDDPMRLDAEA